MAILRVAVFGRLKTVLAVVQLVSYTENIIDGLEINYYAREVPNFSHAVFRPRSVGDVATLNFRELPSLRYQLTCVRIRAARERPTSRPEVGNQSKR